MLNALPTGVLQDSYRKQCIISGLPMPASNQRTAPQRKRRTWLMRVFGQCAGVDRQPESPVDPPTSSPTTTVVSNKTIQIAKADCNVLVVCYMELNLNNSCLNLIHDAAASVRARRRGTCCPWCRWGMHWCVFSFDIFSRQHITSTCIAGCGAFPTATSVLSNQTSDGAAFWQCELCSV